MVLQLSKVRAENPEYVSQLSDQIQEFRRLMNYTNINI